MMKICRLHFIDHVTHIEIANQLKLSRFQVGRLIRQAFDEGIVSLHVNEPACTDSELERYIEGEFPTVTAIVVKNEGLAEDEMKQKMGGVAAGYLRRIITHGDIIGVPWGSTVRKAIGAIPQIMKRNLEVIQVAGGAKNSAMNVDARELAVELALKLRTTARLLNAPLVVDSKKTRDTLLSDSNISNVFGWFSRVTIVLLGIGNLYPVPNKSQLDSGNFSRHELDTMKRRGAVGDIFDHFFDAQGRFIDSDVEERLIAMPVETIRKIPCAVAIAGGRNKAQSIMGALRSHVIRTIVTDTTAVEELKKLTRIAAHMPRAR
jgi:deoxyribonucleoside regulator